MGSLHGDIYVNFALGISLELIPRVIAIMVSKKWVIINYAEFGLKAELFQS